MNIEEIRKHCIAAFRKAGYDFNKQNITVSINGRLTATLGRCKSKYIGGVLVPYEIEISKIAAENAEDQSLVDIIYHECAHALVAITTGEHHKHDAVFKKMCARIGAKADEPTTDVAYTKAEDTLFKYAVYCQNCGFVQGYSRKGKILQNIEYCTCGKCGGSLYYKQNW